MKEKETSYEKLMSTRIYTLDEIYESALIVHPKSIEKYGLQWELIQCLFEEWSNFTRLNKPIIDEYGNHYRDSEGFYMAQRVADLMIKSNISLVSQIPYNSKKTAYKYKHQLDSDQITRIDYMRKTINYKFDINQELQELLRKTKPRMIIEFTYRNDIFFGIDHIQKKWANILWKILQEYRDKI